MTRAAAGDTALEAAWNAFPAPARACLEKLRTLIHVTAAKTPAAGPLTETLKWGEPAFLTEATKSGTTIRLAWKPALPNMAQLLVPCSTPLIEEWRARYGDTLAFSGNRAVLIDIARPIPKAPLAHCIAMALTYHSRKSAP